VPNELNLPQCIVFCWSVQEHSVGSLPTVISSLYVVVVGHMLYIILNNQYQQFLVDFAEAMSHSVEDYILLLDVVPICCLQCLVLVLGGIVLRMVIGLFQLVIW